jgi:phosphatidylethanolamine-binding protein (PEBP) family uncharacterized protein
LAVNFLGWQRSALGQWSRPRCAELSKPSDKFVGGKSTMNQEIYTGPGTPPNTDWHHYTWTIVATALDPKALQPGMTREELAAALKDHVKGSAGLVTRFRHPT